MLRSSSFLTLLVAAPAALAQIHLVADAPGEHDVPLGGSYRQDFNTLPREGRATWIDNTTLRGWYANASHGQISKNRLVTEALAEIHAVAAGRTGPPASLASLAGEDPADRALAGTTEAAAGGDPVFGCRSVNWVLRLRNDSGSVLTGLRVSYRTESSSPANRDAVAFAYKVFAAGTGTITSKFIGTHRYVNPYNGQHGESMRTEYGREVDRTDGWSAVCKQTTPAGTASAADPYTFDLRDLLVEPGGELWLAWHLAKEDELGPDDPGACTGLDDVCLSRFTVGLPGLPFIRSHPRPLAVADDGTRSFALTVDAAGGPLRYQWRRDGTPVADAVGATLRVDQARTDHAGQYDCVVSNARGSVVSLPAKVGLYTPREVECTRDVSFDSYSSSQPRLAAAKAGTLCDLYQPAGLAPTSAKVPAVIVIHGGGGNNGDKSDKREVAAARELAARGWVVMVINHAMSSSKQVCWPWNLWDARQAVRWLRHRSAKGMIAVDPDRIGVVGFSWGCNLGAMLAMTGPDDDAGVDDPMLRVMPPPRGDVYDGVSATIRCAAVFYGATDLPNYHQMNQFLDDTAWSRPELYRRASPVHHPDPGAAPLLFIHGSADDDVWQSQTEVTYHVQRSVKARLEPYLQVPGGRHSFALFEPARVAKGFAKPIDVRPETLGFLESHLVATTVRPSILAEPVAVDAAAGMRARFTIEASGDPVPAFQWRRDGTPLAGANQSVLEVEATRDHQGYYDCVVRNPAGSVTSGAARLAVVPGGK